MSLQTFKSKKSLRLYVMNHPLTSNYKNFIKYKSCKENFVAF